MIKIQAVSLGLLSLLSLARFALEDGWGRVPRRSIAARASADRKRLHTMWAGVTAMAWVDASTPGTEWPPPSTLHRRRPKRLFIMTRSADHAANQVRDAITHFSGGRL